MERRKKRIRRTHKKTNKRLYLLIALVIILAGLAASYIADYLRTASRWNKDYYYPHDREREEYLLNQEDETR
ncbi:MAG: hypothetical protein JW885_08575 [Deltaproteobacteria bacterium]|nr:hypothetical protein [Candidatus Zymogenaceae bacterium]